MPPIYELNYVGQTITPWAHHPSPFPCTSTAPPTPLIPPLTFTSPFFLYNSPNTYTSLYFHCFYPSTSTITSSLPYVFLPPCLYFTSLTLPQRHTPLFLPLPGSTPHLPPSTCTSTSAQLPKWIKQIEMSIITPCIYIHMGKWQQKSGISIQKLTFISRKNSIGRYFNGHRGKH